jgi:hypothetical protein
MFPFAFDQPFAAAALPFGVRPSTCGVVVADGRLRVRFGPWRVETPLTNVATVERTGPYSWWRVIGPARMSAADRGLTFATTDRGGVCITFVEPVRGGEPTGRLRHPGLTVTVADPDALVAELTEGGAGGPTVG